jgi:hypothetical protein
MAVDDTNLGQTPTDRTTDRTPCRESRTQYRDDRTQCRDGRGGV